jgi:hypothetical protein
MILGTFNHVCQDYKVSRLFIIRTFGYEEIDERCFTFLS